MGIIVAEQRPQIPLSSSGLTGRSSNPRRACLIAADCDYWIPAFRGYDEEKRA